MEIESAVVALTALAQKTRLAIFRLLVEAGPQGIHAGAIAEVVGVPAATLSFHVSRLVQAGLVVARQESRFIFYSANFAVMDELLAFLADDCCKGGRRCLPRTTAVSANRKSRRKAV